MNEDISKNTLLVLVALTIIVSLLGTWTVYNEALNVRQSHGPMVAPEQTAEGKVTLSIRQPAAPVAATGRVALMIVED